MERWIVIDEAPRYAISDYGAVQNLKTERILKAAPNSDGYMQVVLATSNGSITRKVHRLVAIAFLPCEDYSLEVNHIHPPITDNRVWNLEWATRSQNQRHAFRTGLHWPRRGGLIRNDQTDEIFETQQEAADAVNVSQAGVALVLNGARHNIKGYTFHYVRDEV